MHALTGSWQSRTTRARSVVVAVYALCGTARKGGLVELKQTQPWFGISTGKEALPQLRFLLILCLGTVVMVQL